jgi:hypothetical protein
MSLETTTCPRCESTSTAHLPESIGFNQWICNQCSHQWEFASQEERALVPTHLTGGRIEQFLEEFLAIKAVIKGESARIWNDSANGAHQAISITGNEDKIRLFGEQVDLWRDQLIGLQENLIIDRLLPLEAKYQVSSNEQIWLSQACHEAMRPVTAGFVDWFTFAIRGQLYGAESWVIPDWAWRLRGAPRQIADLDVTQDEKVSSLLHCLAGTLEHDLAMHRKEAIAKAFLALKTTWSSPEDGGGIANAVDHRPAPLQIYTAKRDGESPARSTGELQTGPHERIPSQPDSTSPEITLPSSNIRLDPKERIRSFRWEDIDHKLVSLRLIVLAEEMRAQIEADEKRITFENRDNLNSNTVPSLVLKMKQDRADEWAERAYAIYCEVWQTQGHVKSAAFVRAVSAGAIQPFLQTRAAAIAARFSKLTRPTNLPFMLRDAHLQSLRLNMGRLEGRWRRRLEIEARQCEHAEQRARPEQQTVERGAEATGKTPTKEVAEVSRQTPGGESVETNASNRSVVEPAASGKIRKPGRKPRLGESFVIRAGTLWQKAISESPTKVSIDQLRQIAASLDGDGYLPPGEYLEGVCARELKAFNSRNSNSKIGPIRTWLQLVSLDDKNYPRSIRRLLSRCSKKLDGRSSSGN